MPTAVRIHQANDQADAGAPYGGFGMSSAFDILVPEHAAAKARALLAKGEPRDPRGRRR